MIKQNPLFPFLIVKKIEIDLAPKGLATNPAVKKNEINFGEIQRIPKEFKDHKTGKYLKTGQKLQWKEYTGAPIAGTTNLFVIDIEEILYILDE